MLRQHPHVRTVLTAAAATVAIAGPLAIIDHRSQVRGQARQLETVQACERGNMLRAVIVAREPNARRVLPLIDCERTVRAHRDVPLTGAQADRVIARARAVLD